MGPPRQILDGVAHGGADPFSANHFGCFQVFRMANGANPRRRRRRVDGRRLRSSSRREVFRRRCEMVNNTPSATRPASSVPTNAHRIGSVMGCALRADGHGGVELRPRPLACDLGPALQRPPLPRSFQTAWSRLTGPTRRRRWGLLLDGARAVVTISRWCARSAHRSWPGGKSRLAPSPTRGRRGCPVPRCRLPVARRQLPR